jgi:hypothetical protein
VGTDAAPAATAGEPPKPLAAVAAAAAADTLPAALFSAAIADDDGLRVGPTSGAGTVPGAVNAMASEAAAAAAAALAIAAADVDDALEYPARGVEIAPPRNSDWTVGGDGSALPVGVCAAATCVNGKPALTPRPRATGGYTAGAGAGPGPMKNCCCCCCIWR